MMLDVVVNNAMTRSHNFLFVWLYIWLQYNFATVWVVNRSHVPHCQTSHSLRDPVASLLTICSIILFYFILFYFILFYFILFY